MDEACAPADFNEVKGIVNRAVGRTVLQPYAGPSKYRLIKETYGLVREKAEERADEDD